MTMKNRFAITIDSIKYFSHSNGWMVSLHGLARLGVGARFAQGSDNLFPRALGFLWNAPSCVFKCFSSALEHCCDFFLILGALHFDPRSYKYLGTLLAWRSEVQSVCQLFVRWPERSARRPGGWSIELKPRVLSDLSTHYNRVARIDTHNTNVLRLQIAKTVYSFKTIGT